MKTKHCLAVKSSLVEEYYEELNKVGGQKWEEGGDFSKIFPVDARQQLRVFYFFPNRSQRTTKP